MSLMDSAEKAVASTVEIFTELGTGSGFIVHPNGLIATARHVVNDEEDHSYRYVKVRLADGSEKEGVVVRSHRQLDFALVWLSKDAAYPALPIGKPGKLRFGESVFAVGSPSGLSNTVSKGIVSNPSQNYHSVSCIQTDAAISFGNSGGPLISEDGAVGIMVWGHVNPVTGTEVSNANFAVPLDYLLDDIDSTANLGRANSLKATYCVSCGFLDAGEKTWYCRNCGITLPQARTRRKSQSLEEILAACDEHSRKVYGLIVEGWQKLGFTVQPGVGSISLRAPIKGKTLGLAALRANMPNYPPIIVIGWESYRRLEVFPTRALNDFQINISRLFRIKLTASSAHLIVGNEFDEEKAAKFLEELSRLAKTATE